MSEEKEPPRPQFGKLTKKDIKSIQRALEDWGKRVYPIIGRGELTMIQEEMYEAQPWIKDWESGELDLDEEAVNWMRERPEAVKELMLKFPPSCLVTANQPLMCPAPGTVGIITSYWESEKLVTVRQSPDSGTRTQCAPEWLTVVGYYKGLTPERVAEILK